MKYIFRVLLCCMFAITGQATYATQAPGELQVVSVSDTSIQIDWEDVTDVLGYYIYYGESSGSGSEYDIEGIDLIEESTYILTELQPDTTYYIAITAVDDTGSESEKSPELESSTLPEGEVSQVSNLRLMQVEVVDDTSIAMQFSTDMETGTNASRQFIIENLDSGEEISVDISDVIPGEPTNILIILGSPLLPNSEYKITVLDIRDTQGNTIESGIDAFLNFTTPEAFEMSFESAGTEEIPIESEQIEEIFEQEEFSDSTDMMNNPILGEENFEAPTGNNAGTTISSEELSGNTLVAASNNDTLPQTGPEHWILILVAVMLGTGLFYKIRK